jgi:hypothetical protein
MTTSKQFIDIVAGSGFAEDVPEDADPVVEFFDMAGVHGLVLWSVADLLSGMCRGSAMAEVIHRSMVERHLAGAATRGADNPRTVANTAAKSTGSSRHFATSAEP